MAQTPVLSIRDNLTTEQQAIFDAVEQVQDALDALTTPLETVYRNQIKGGIYQIRRSLQNIVSDAWSAEIEAANNA